MIAIVSSVASERTAFTVLCESRGWSSVEWDTVRAAVRRLQRVSPRVLLMRHRLSDGYSDDVLAALKTTPRRTAPKVIVLVGAGTASLVEARQLALGADCVQRDPIRTDVLLEYLAKYCATPHPSRRAGNRRDPNTILFAGTTLHVIDRTLQRGGDFVPLTPREVEVAELLYHSQGEVVSYETLYTDVLGRRFRGDTSNMRVLLGKLSASMDRVGIDLRGWVEVIPKTGYRYTQEQSRSARNSTQHRV